MFENIREDLKILITEYALQVVGALVVLIVGFWLATRLTRLAKRIMEKRGYEASVRSFLGSIVNIGLKGLVLLSVASMFGINVVSFVAVFSAMALAIGLALQGHLANFASGVLILIFKFFRVGDFIEANGEKGTVKNIHIFHTVLEALDNRLITIPNGEITKGSIHNYTVQGWRRHDLTVGIGYDDDIDLARSTIEEVVKGLPDVRHDLGHDIFIKELADSSVNFAVRFATDNEFFWPAYKLFFERIKKEFDAQSIGIPYPQMDVHLHGEQA